MNYNVGEEIIGFFISVYFFCSNICVGKLVFYFVVNCVFYLGRYVNSFCYLECLKSCLENILFLVEVGGIEIICVDFFWD